MDNFFQQGPVVIEIITLKLPRKNANNPSWEDLFLPLVMAVFKTFTEEYRHSNE